MSEERVYPGSTACHLIERCRYDWKGSGWLEAYVIIVDGKHMRTRFIDVAYQPGFTGGLGFGWETPQPIDEHQYAAALQRRIQFPPVSRDAQADTIVSPSPDIKASPDAA